MIDPTSNLKGFPFVLPNQNPKASSAVGESGFSDLLGDLVHKVADKQQDANQAVSDVVTGKITNVHEASVKVQEAGVAFDLMLGVRNRLMQAYNELLKVQV